MSLELDFVLDRYDKELERRDDITAAVNFPITILVIFGSALVAMSKDMPLDGGPLDASFVTSMAGTVMVVGVALWNYSWAYLGQKYEYLPTLGLLEEASEESSDEEEEEEFEANLRRSIIEASDSNNFANETRQAYMEQGNIFLLLAAIFTAVTGGFYVFEQIAKS